MVTWIIYIYSWGCTSHWIGSEWSTGSFWRGLGMVHWRGLRAIHSRGLRMVIRVVYWRGLIVHWRGQSIHWRGSRVVHLKRPQSGPLKRLWNGPLKRPQSGPVKNPQSTPLTRLPCGLLETSEWSTEEASDWVRMVHRRGLRVGHIGGSLSRPKSWLLNRP